MKSLNAIFSVGILMLALLFAPAAHGQCDKTYPNGAVVAHALQDQTVRSLVMPMRQGNFWIETVSVTQTQDGYHVAWIFEPRCRTEPPYCALPTQIVCADLDCDLNVLAICLS